VFTLTKITQLSEAILQEYRASVEAHLAGLVKGHGLNAVVSVGLSGRHNGSVRVNLQVCDEHGPITEEREHYLDSGMLLFGLKPEWLFADFFDGDSHRGYRVVGLNPSSMSKPVVCLRDDGKIVKLSANIVRDHLLTKAMDAMAAAATATATATATVVPMATDAAQG
jgi:hypothetical protein